MPLLFSFGAVDDGEPLLDGELLDDEDDDGVELDDAFVSDEAGGVPDADDDAPVPVDEVDGLIDELDDDEPLGVAGVVDDDEEEGDGDTVGGAVVLLVDVSRLQPARPSASPVQNSVINAIFISDPP